MTTHANYRILCCIQTNVAFKHSVIFLFFLGRTCRTRWLGWACLFSRSAHPLSFLQKNIQCLHMYNISNNSHFPILCKLFYCTTLLYKYFSRSHFYFLFIPAIYTYSKFYFLYNLFVIQLVAGELTRTIAIIHILPCAVVFLTPLLFLYRKYVYTSLLLSHTYTYTHTLSLSRTLFLLYYTSLYLSSIPIFTHHLCFLCKNITSLPNLCPCDNIYHVVSLPLFISLTFQQFYMSDVNRLSPSLSLTTNRRKSHRTHFPLKAQQSKLLSLRTLITI